MARAIPVLPLVASMSVSPGAISPRASASAIMLMAGRSFTEPAGLLPSSLASRVLLVSPGKALQAHQRRVADAGFDCWVIRGGIRHGIPVEPALRRGGG
jgi:hypothetical protein